MGSIKGIADNQFMISLNMYTYIRLAPGTDPKDLSRRINNFYVERPFSQLSQFLGMSEDQVMNSGSRVGMDITPMKDIHLKSHGKFELEENGNIEYVRIFISVAFLILLLACINFINLSTARAVRRAKEVGIRKVVGSGRFPLVSQFVGESFLFTILSYILAMVIVEFSIPVFKNISGYDLRGFYIDKSWFWLSSAGVVVVVGFFSGLYPAIVLSSYKPIDVIRALPAETEKDFFFRNSLVTFQFIITGVILLAVILVSRQMNYIQSRELGFDKEKILVIERTDPIKTSVKYFMDELGKTPRGRKRRASVPVCCAVDSAPTGFQYLRDNEPKTLLAANLTVNHDFADVLGLQLVQGRFFNREYTEDNNIIVNETAVKEMGMKEPLGKYVYFNNRDSGQTHFHMIGVLKDFHFESLHDQIRPLVLSLTTEYFDGYIMVACEKAIIFRPSTRSSRYGANSPLPIPSCIIFSTTISKSCIRRRSTPAT